MTLWPGTMRRCLSMCVLLCAIAGQGPNVHATGVIHNGQMSTGPHSGFTVESPFLVQQGQVYSQGRLAWLTPAGESVGSHRMDVNGTIGLGITDTLVVTWTLPLVATMETGTTGVQDRSLGVGDPMTRVLWSIRDFSQGVIGLLAGLNGTIPLGHTRGYTGLGSLSVHPFVSLGVGLFGAQLVVNGGYRWLDPAGPSFVTDDAVVWSAMLRVEKEAAVNWSLEANGIVVPSFDPGEPSAARARMSQHWFGGGIEFAVGRQRTLGIYAAIILPDTDRPNGFLFSARVRRPRISTDDDRDGIPNRIDKCRYLQEDYDGFEDEDGCPDLDNDKDGFPDKEDRCPDTPAMPFSDDGC